MADTPKQGSQRSATSSRPTLVGPAVRIAPAASDTGEANVIVLFPQPLEYLCVQLIFHRRAVVGLPVRFTTLDGSEVEGGLLTDQRGVVHTGKRVPIGAYSCEIENQPPVRVNTVPSLERGYPVTLPIGRPYRDLHERTELPESYAKPLRSRMQTRS